MVDRLLLPYEARGAKKNEKINKVSILKFVAFNFLYIPGAFRTGAGLGAVILLWPLPFEEAMGILDLAGTRPPAPVKLN